MSEQIVPKRFGLKYSPKPAIALEYEKANSGIRVLEVTIEQLAPESFDVEGVLNALQNAHPEHLGPSMVSAHQLERLVSRLLFEGRPHLPGEYTTPAGKIANDFRQQQICPSIPDDGSTPKFSLRPKSDDYSSGGNSTGPTPAPTPEVQRSTRDVSDGGSSAAGDPVSHDSDEDDKSGGDQGSESDICADVEVKGGKLRAVGREETQGGRGVGVEKDLPSRNDDGGKERDTEHEEKCAERAADGTARGSDTGEDEDQGVPIETEMPSSLAAYRHSPSDENRTIHGEERSQQSEDDGSFDDEGGADGDSQGDEDGGGTDHRRNGSGTNGPSLFSPRTVGTPVTADGFASNHPHDLSSPMVEDSLGNNASERKEIDGDVVSDKREQDDDDIDTPEDVEIEPSDEVAQAGKEGTGGDDKTSRGQADIRSKGDDDIDHRVGATLVTSPPDIAGSREVESSPAIKEEKSEDLDGEDDSAGDDAQATETLLESLGKGRGERTAERVLIQGEKTDDGDLPRSLGVELHASQTNSGEDRSLDSKTEAEREAGTLRFLESRTTSPPPPLSPLSALGEKETVSSPISPHRPSRGPATLSSSPSRVEGGGTSASSPAGLPLPPMSSARQKLSALGSLPPVGSRGLPSLTLPFGSRRSAAGEENEGLGRAAGGGYTSDGFSPRAKAEDSPISGRTSTPVSPLSSAGFLGIPGARSPTAGRGRTPDATKRKLAFPGNSRGENDRTSDAGEPGGLNKAGEGGKDEEEGVAALRARLGLGEDGSTDEDKDSGGGEEPTAGSKASGASSPAGSPKQHQGQEEENAGRISATVGLRGEAGQDAKKEHASGPVKGGGGGGGDYFGESDEEISEEDILEEISSVGEDISFEQESASSGGGGGAGGSDGDYFS